MTKIDINCDVGEGMLNEPALFPLISSCNIACGGHFGSAKTIDKAIVLALKHNVKIGAHPSFPDQENFGRKLIKISNEALSESLETQIEFFLERLAKVNQKLHHIKPHGALYNRIAIDTGLAEVFIDSISKYLTDSCLYVPYQSKIEEVALYNNINISYEAFADRNYTNSLRLVDRRDNNSVIQQPKKVFEHVYFMLKENQVVSIEGKKIQIKADTFCIHGDNENAVAILNTLHKELTEKGIAVQ